MALARLRRDLSVAESPARCKLVLIVEDELLIGIAFQAAFEEEGFEAQIATSPEEAFAFLAHETPAAAVVDLNLHEPMVGVEVVRRLAARGVKVAICSACVRAPSHLALISRSDRVQGE